MIRLTADLSAVLLTAASLFIKSCISFALYDST